MNQICSIFVVMTFIHFVVDWVFQSHDQAMAKATDHWARAGHCAIYAFGFLPLLVWQDIYGWKFVECLAILFLSHFIEDTYLPVYWWAKYIRRPVVGPSQAPWRLQTIDDFKLWSRSPLGLILIIAVDQIVHLSFLWVVAWLVAK